MKKTLLTLILTLICLLVFPCGGSERWDVKTLTDPGASKVDYKHIRLASITDLVILTPGQIGNTTPRHGAEFGVVAVTCSVSYWKYEADSDIHIVMNDLKYPSTTMIAEIPSPNCEVAKQSKFVDSFSNSKRAFLTFKKTAHTIQPGIYEITRVIFFDKLHGQTGLAIPSGVELHPILHFRKIK
jgi:hypothetical protein